MNQDILKKFSSHSEVQNSPYHKHISGILKKHVDELLHATAAQEKIKNLADLLMKERVIIFPHDHRFYSWLMNPWIVTTGLISLIKNMSGSMQRDRLDTLAKTTKKQITSLKNLKRCPDFLISLSTRK